VVYHDAFTILTITQETKMRINKPNIITAHVRSEQGNVKITFSNNKPKVIIRLRQNTTKKNN